MNRTRSTQYTKLSSSSSLVKKFIILDFLILIGVLVGGYVWYSIGVNRSLSSSEDVQYFNVEQGMTRDQIAQQLVDLEMMDSTNLFVLYTRISGEGGDIKAGNHILKKNMSIKEIVAELENTPDEDTVWVTIPEGLRYDEIASIIAKAYEGEERAQFDKQRFLDVSEDPWNQSYLAANPDSFLAQHLPKDKSIEGFLYPDTYNFRIDASAEEIITILVATMRQKLEADDIVASNGSLNVQTEKDLYEILNIASMLEREAFTEQEARMIADVIDRRREIGLQLYIDATSLYYLKDWEATLTFAELRDPNPYNTRVNTGLPPTPIANPGITTINAVLNPIENEYFYYLHGNDGQIRYAKTNAEHETNIAKYL